MFYESGNPFQLVTNAWPPRMTLELKVTWCCTLPLLTLAVFVLSWWFFFVSNVLSVRKSIPTSHKCVTSTDDFETLGHVMLYVNFTNFGCVCPRTMNFVLFQMFFGSGAPFQLVTNAWPLRMTLKLKVTWCCAWPSLTFAVFVLERWTIFVYNVLLVKEFIPTSHKCVTSTDDLETQDYVMLYVTFTNFGCVCLRTMNIFLFLMFFGSGIHSN